MKTNRIIFAATVLAAVTLLSAALILAQGSTSAPTPEATSVASTFNDARINGNVFLGGLAIYCVDQNGNSSPGMSFVNGGITIWGIGDQEYFALTVDQLRGNEEIPQPPPTMEPGMTVEPMMTVTPMPTMSASATQEVMTPVLLARSDTPNGTMWLFRVGADQFALQGNDNTGKFFTYAWTGCGIGTLSTDTLPFDAMEMMPMTAEATASS